MASCGPFLLWASAQRSRFNKKKAWNFWLRERLFRHLTDLTAKRIALLDHQYCFSPWFSWPTWEKCLNCILGLCWKAPFAIQVLPEFALLDIFQGQQGALFSFPQRHAPLCGIGNVPWTYCLNSGALILVSRLSTKDGFLWPFFTMSFCSKVKIKQKKLAIFGWGRGRSVIWMTWQPKE